MNFKIITMKLPKIQTLQQNSENSNGERCLYVRIFIEGRYIRKSTGIWIREQDWDKKKEAVRRTRPDYRKLNEEIDKLRNNIMSEMTLARENLCYDTVANILGNRSAKKQPVKQESDCGADGNPDFFEYASQIFLKRYNCGKICYSTYKNQIENINYFRKYTNEILGKKPLRISDISVDLIKGYMEEIIATKSKYTLMCRMSTIRTTIKTAMAEDVIDKTTAQGIILMKHNEKVTKYEPNISGMQNKKYLSEDKISELYEMTKIKTTGVHAGNISECIEMFLFSFFTCGLRVSDILTLEWQHIDMDKGTIRKMMVKSKRVPEVDIPIAPAGMKILRKWLPRTGNRKFVFGQIEDDIDMNDQRKLYRRIKSQESRLNKYLKMVAKKIHVPKLTMHMARHSFAVMSIRKGVNIYLLSKLMGHAGVGVTEKIYAKVINDRSVMEQLPYAEF